MQVPDDGLRPWAADIAAVFKNAGRSLAISAKHDMLLVGREDGHISEFSLSRGTPRDDWPQGKGGSVIRIEVEPSERWAVLVSRDTDDILHLHYEVRDLTTRRVVGKPWSRKEAHPHAALFLANGALRLGCDENGEVETRDLPEGNGRAWGPWKDLAAPPADLTPARLQALCPAKSDNSWEPRRHVFSENWVVQPSYQAAAELRQLGGADTGWHPVGPSSNNEKTQLFGFSRDGRVLASASSGGEVRLWNPADGRMIDAPRRFVHGTPVSLAITPGAERVAVLSSGVVQVFVTAFHDGRSICRWFPEPVTPAQWTAWVGDRIAFRPTCGEDLVR
jgi:WD40 repeat protein